MANKIQNFIVIIAILAKFNLASFFSKNDNKIIA